VSGLPPIAPLGAVQFLTRVPIRLRAAPDLAACVPWFPVVGGAIGATIGLVVAGLMEVLPPLVAAAIGVVFGIVLTGAFHEDGLADTADALGGWTPEQRREILKDSRHGSYGVAAMCSTIVIRVVCVASLGPAAAFAGLIAAHTLGRGAAVAVMFAAPGVPGEGLGSDYARGLTARRTVLGVAGGLAIAAAATGWWVVPLAAAATAGAWAVAGIVGPAFGGVSGDVLGAVEQVGECAVLIVVTALALHHPLWWI
jgi:adenosylcobinamide-GDP ribazoletransferase